MKTLNRIDIVTPVWQFDVNANPITKVETKQTDRRSFAWSNRNFVDGWHKTFYYCPGSGFETGNKVYYGRNDWSIEADAIAAQERWEARCEALNLSMSASNTATT